MLSVSDAFKTAAAASTRRVLAKVECYFDGINVVDISAYVNRFEIVRERFYEQEGTIPLGNYSAGQITIELDNTDKRFSPYNTEGPYYGYLIPNRKIVVQLGFVTGSGDEYCGGGEFYSVKWGAGQEATARVVARDKSMLLQRQEYEAAVQEGSTISELVEMICDDVGITALQREIGETTIPIPYASFCPEYVWENLRQMAIGEGGYIYFDEEGKLIFENRSHLAGQTESLLTLDDDSFIVTLNHEVDQQRIRNRVRVGRKQLSEAAQTTIWSLDEELTVPGTSNWWDADWGRRRNVEITAAGGAGNDLTTSHALLLVITGTAAAQIYANSLSNQDDVRVVYNDSGVYHDLNRYVDEFSSTRITIYFRPYKQINAGNSDSYYWIYYDNSDAGAATSNPSSIFQKFDDFDRSSIGSNWDFDASYWDIYNNDQVRRENDSSNRNCVWDSADTQTNVEVAARIRIEDQPANNQFVGCFVYTGKSLTVQYGGMLTYSSATGKWTPWIKVLSGGTPGTAFGINLANPHRIRVTRQGAGATWKVYVDETQRVSATETEGASWYGLLSQAGPSGEHVFFDNWWVRYLTPDDPSFTLGIQEFTPSGGENTLTIYIRWDDPAVDIQAPVITSGGPDLSVDSYTYYSCSGVIVIKNTGASQAIDGLTVDGKLLEESDTIFAEAVDQDSIDDYGEQAYAVENTYIQSSEHAQAMADALLAEYLNPGRQITVQMPSRAQPHLQLGDRITVQNEATGINGDYHVVRHRMVYDGGLHGELTCLEA